jgi:hypothetical protein
MFSLLRKGLLYKDISPDIVEHDQDIDADQWVYDGRDVYRGRYDPRYTEYNLNVYWLYDENLNRVGLAEHDADEKTIYKALWFYENPYATLYQNTEWKPKGKTFWSMLSNEAYQDALEDDFKSIFDRCLYTKYRLVTPEFLVNPPTVYECSACGKKSISQLKKCKDVSTTPYFDFSDFLFVDDSFILYNPPSTQLSSSYEQEPLLAQAESVDPQELQHVEPALPQEQEQEPLQPLHSHAIPPPLEHPHPLP